MAAYHARLLPRAWRWFGIVMRALHLVAVVLLGAALLGAPPSVSVVWVGSTLLVTGALMFALEQWKTHEHLFQLAGAGQIAKLALVAWMMLEPSCARPIYWLIVVWSAVFAHAPAGFRHAHIADLLGIARGAGR
jgi:ABC-type enterochelin transport system permease subunit